MSQTLNFQPSPALKMAKDKAKSEFTTVKQSIAKRTDKTSGGNFLTEITNRTTPPKPQNN